MGNMITSSYVKSITNGCVLTKPYGFLKRGHKKKRRRGGGGGGGSGGGGGGGAEEEEEEEEEESNNNNNNLYSAWGPFLPGPKTSSGKMQYKLTRLETIILSTMAGRREGLGRVDADVEVDVQWKWVGSHRRKVSEATVAR